jgi:protein-S-isoprenylcysteine O-methyltransferase Ste14
MVEQKEHRLGDEHPLSDKAQLVLLAFLICIWIIDSFVLKLYIITSVPLPLKLITALILAAFGVYLIENSHRLVIDAEEPELITTGVYSLTRHPMYLGIMLFELGIVATTLSIPALLFWVLIFLAYNQFAAFEEESLIRNLGDDYHAYMSRVKRWGIL